MRMDRIQFNKMLSELSRLPNNLLDSGAEVFKQNTPQRTGNAKRSTSRRGSDTILADYDYASRLDDGASSQSPAGMTDPTIAHWEQKINSAIRRL